MSNSLDEGGKLYEMLLLIDETERGIHDMSHYELTASASCLHLVTLQQARTLKGQAEIERTTLARDTPALLGVSRRYDRGKRMEFVPQFVF